MDAVNNPEDPAAGTRKVPVLARAVDRAGRLPRDAAARSTSASRPGVEVRLRYAYVVKCTGLTKDPATGEVTEVRCHLRPRDPRAATARAARSRRTIHWVSAAHAVEAEVRLYDTLFTVPKPDEAADFKSVINPRLARDGARRQGRGRARGGRARGATCSSSASATSSRDWKDHRPRPPGLQPQRRPARHLGARSRRPAPSRLPAAGGVRGPRRIGCPPTGGVRGPRRNGCPPTGGVRGPFLGPRR